MANKNRNQRLGDVGIVQRGVDIVKGNRRCLAARCLPCCQCSRIEDGGYDGTDWQGSLVSYLLEYI